MRERQHASPKARRFVYVLILALGVLVYRGWHRGQPHSIGAGRALSILAQRHLRPGAEMAAHPASRITGRVRDAQRHTPLAGAIVSLDTSFRPEGWEEISVGETRPPVHVRTDAQGRFTLLAALDPSETAQGMLRITATHPGYLPAHIEQTLDRDTSIELLLQPGGVALSGTVSEVDGGVVVGALVYAQNDDDAGDQPPRDVTLTDEHGHYRLDLPPGDYTITFVTFDHVGAVRSAKLYRLPVTLDMELTPGAGVSGTVLTAAHEPLAGAVVSAQGGLASSIRWFGRYRPEVRTNAAGQFHLRGLGSGAITLAVRGKGGATREPVRLDLALGEERRGVVIVVEPAFTLSGRVVQADPRGPVPGSTEPAGPPIAGAEIRLSQGIMHGIFSKATSDSTGRFAIEGLLPDKYNVYVRAPGYLETDIVVLRQPDHDRNDLVFSLRRGRTLRGRIEPPARAQVAWSPGDLRALGLGGTRPIRTDDSGRFELRGIPDGAGDVAAETTDHRRASATVAQALGDVDGIVLTLAVTATVEGQVVDAGGVPVTEVDVSAQPEAPAPDTTLLGRYAQSIVSGEGRFVLIGLLPGTYRLSVRRGFDTVPLLAPESALVTLGNGEVKRDIPLQVESLRASIQGQVLTAGGAPAPDCWVQCAPSREEGSGSRWYGGLILQMQQSPPALTDRNGRFVVRDLYQARYRCVTEQHDAQAEASDIALGSHITLRLQPLASLSGQVRQRGAPVTRYHLQVDNTEVYTHQTRNVTDAQGRFHLEHLQPGRYQVEARSNQGVAVAWLELGREAKTLDLELLPLGNLRGRVIDALTGQSLSGVALRASNTPTASPFAADSGSGEDTDILPTTDAQGRFEISGINTGYGQLIVLRNRVGRDLANQAVKLGEAIYQMEGGATLDLGDIRVVDAPAPGSFVPGSLDFTARSYPELVQVGEVIPGGVAQASGLQAGDGIVAVDGVQLSTVGVELGALLLAPERIRRGQTVALTLLRNGTSIAVTLQAR